jgi:hypothetical protein
VLEGVSVFGKKYFTVQSIERFEDRALAGEFARAPRGAAAWPTDRLKGRETLNLKTNADAREQQQ